MKRLKFPLTIIMLVLSLIVLFILAWAIIFYSYYTALIAFIGILVFFPLKLGNKHLWLIRAIVFLLGLVLLISTIHIPIGEINNRISSLANKPRSKNSISSFSIRDKIGIYGLNLIMGIFAYPIYPEISKETLMMVFPSPKDGVRTFESDFVIYSKKVSNVLVQFNKTLKNEKGKEVKLKKHIYWNVNDYSLGEKESRYALALNPAIISMIALKKNTEWEINVSLKVKCSYPQNSNVTLISHPELKVEEGLFWILQEAGWLFPYTAEWKFTINAGDKRVN